MNATGESAETSAGVREDDNHPALPRLERSARGAPGVLVVQAPMGTGRRWLAQGWCRANGDHESAPSRVITWARGTEATTIVDEVLPLTADSSPERVAVLASPDAPVGELAARLECRVVGPAELFLTPAEIAEYQQREEFGGGTIAAEEVHRLTGGWLTAVDSLCAAPAGSDVAYSTIVGPLRHWLGLRDPEEELLAAAYLPAFSDQVLEALPLQGEGDGPLTADRLSSEGLLVRDAAGGSVMPAFTRRVLQELARERGSERVTQLVEMAARAAEATGGFDAAVETALQARAWTALRRIVTDGWADLFASDARVLRRLVERLPAAVREKSEFAAVGMRILSNAGPDRMVLPLPAIEPDLTKDQTALRLRERTERMYRRPTASALSYGLLEIGHLRLAGHYVESAEAAVRLRRALAEAMSSQGVPLAMAALVELHAGMSLHLADRLRDAQLAYESALHWARSRGQAFLQADATSKLALVYAQLGNVAQTRRHLSELATPLETLSWGKRMVARSGELARIWLALADLDIDEAKVVLDSLPDEPDTDEFWALHAYFMTVAGCLQGDPEKAERRLQRWRVERPYAASAPLADRLFAEASGLARALQGEVEPIDDWRAHPALANMEGLRRISAGDLDGAALALQQPRRDNPHDQNVAAMLRAIVADGGPGHVAMEAIGRIHSDRGELADLLPLHVLGLTPRLLTGGVIDDDQARRLGGVPATAVPRQHAPRLTPREEEVLALLREGLTRRQIAERTFRSENTIKGQLRGLYSKLGASTAKQALESARRLKL